MRSWMDIEGAIALSYSKKFMEYHMNFTLIFIYFTKLS